MINARKLLPFITSSAVALVSALFFIKWRPAHAAVPGSAGNGVVNPAFGSYGDSIEIDVPDYYDLAPELKLVYGSSAGNGVTGMGWSLSGESFIERTSAEGGTPTYTTGDKFVLDGGKLLADASLGGTHVTQHQSYLRIAQDSAKNQWCVWQKDGTKRTYSPLYIVRNNSSPTFNDVYRWALTREEDTDGHVVTYRYWTDPGQNSYLDSISYNGCTIKLWREARPDDISFADGIHIGHTNYRIKTIDIRVGSAIRSAYKLSYTTSPNSSRSLLSAVREFGTDAVIDASGSLLGGTSLPGQTMTYTSPTTSLFPSNLKSDTAIGTWNTTFRYMLADVNGDGKSDMVDFYKHSGDGLCHVWVKLSNGRDFTGGSYDTAVGTWDTDFRYMMADVNGDGRADVVDFYKHAGDGTCHVWVKLSSGGQFNGGTFDTPVGTWNTTFRYMTADVDGDGRADVVDFYKNADDLTCHAWVKLSSGGKFDGGTYDTAIGTWSADFQYSLHDVNGDGRADVVDVYKNAQDDLAHVWVKLSSGGKFTAGTFDTLMGTWNTTFFYNFADVNGDGKEDVVWVYKQTADGQAHVRTLLSDGGQFNFASDIVVGTWNTDFRFEFTDLNGDGLQDFIDIYKKTTDGLAHAACWYSTGIGFRHAGFDLLIGTWNTSFIYGFADITGDGRADLYDIYQRSVDDLAHIQVQPTLPISLPLPDLLASISNGKGGTTAIGYTPSGEWPSSFMPRGGNFPTVTTIAIDDGRGKSGTTTYSYADSKHSLADKVFLGFRLQEAVVDDLGTYVETFNRQTPQSVGEADAIYTRNNSGQIYGYTTYTYNESGNGVDAPYITQVTTSSEFELNLGAGGRETRTSYRYDQYGNQTQIIYEGDVAVTGDEFTKTISYTYNPDLYLMDLEQSEQKYAGISVVAANKVDESIYYYDGATSTFALPTKGNLTRTDSWNNQTGTYLSASGTFDSFGNQTSSTDPRGATSTTTFDPIYHQYPIQSSNALGHSTTCVWDYVRGLALSTTDENGATTLYGYDVLGRPTSLTDAAGNITTTDYFNLGDPNNQRVRKTVPDGSADGLWTDTYSDGLGRVYKSVREGPSAGVSYIKEAVYNDADENPQQVSLWYQSGAAPRWEIFQYDGVGRLLRTTHADGSFATIAYGVDSAGKPFTTMTDEIGHQRSTWIDTAEHVTRVMEKNGGLFYNTYRTYDVEGRLTKIQDTNNNITTYTYNSLGQNIATSDINTGVVVNTFDAGGAVLSEADAKGQTTTFTYDALGRLKTKTAGGETTTWYYDEAGYGASLGELTRIVYPTGSEAYSYNKLGQVTSATKTIGAISKTIAHTYDALGRANTLTYPDGEVVTYSYGADGALFSVSGYVDALVYGPNGELIQLTYSNGTTSTFDYDPNRLWLNAANVKSGSTVLYSGAYTYNAVQHVTSMSHGTPTPQTTVYTYDDLGRLLSVDGAQTQSFTYDALGNMMTNSLKGAYSYSDPNHRHAVTRAGSSVYTYDASGNMQTGNGKIFSWDAQDRLSSVTQGPAVTSFAYGAGHDRIKKTQGANTTLYFSGLFEQINGSSVQYIYAGSILVAKKDSAGTKTWYHADRLGSIRLMTNDAGAEVKDYDYRPFGEVLTTSGTVANERGFTGQIADAETGLMYYNARYYDATLGRFISADTAVQAEDDPQDLNAYSYCSNNPVNYNDPTGHIRVFAGMMRYVTWSRVTVSRSITVRVPYVVIYPTFSFYWRTVSVSKTVTWWFFGWHQKTISVSIQLPATRVTWHVRTGYHTYHRTIRFSVMVPHVHFKAIYRNVVAAAKRIQHKAQHAYDRVKKAGHRVARNVAHAAKATGRWASQHKQLLTTIAIVAVVAAITVSTGGAGALLGAGLAARFVSGGISAGASAALDISAGKSWKEVAGNAALQGGLGFASVGASGVIGRYTHYATHAASAGRMSAKAGKIANVAANTGFSFVKDTANGLGQGKSLGDSLGGAALGAVAGVGLNGAATRVAGGWNNPKMAAAGATLGNAWGQVTARLQF